MSLIELLKRMNGMANDDDTLEMQPDELNQFVYSDAKSESESAPHD